MKASTAPVVAWSLWAVVVALAGAMVTLVVVIASQPTVGILLDDVGIDDARIMVVVMTGIPLVMVAGATLGTIVATRKPANPVGWLLIAAALLGVLLWVADHYVALGGFVAPGSLPGIEWAALALVGIGPAWVVSILLTVWLFPTGRLWSRRWRSVLAVALSAHAAATLLLLVTPGPIHLFQTEGLPSVENPIGITELDWLSGRGDAVDALALAFALVLTLAGLAARFRRSRGEERAQLKWFLYAWALFLVAAVLGSFFAGPVALVSYVVAPLVVPVAMTVAILRYRLYEIDRLISRTVAYALVTALLAGIYTGLVLLFGIVLRPVTADSDLVVAASVLVVAALFQPLRRRVQGAVDQRFNRTHHDAERTIAAFGERLRAEVDLDTLSEELTGVVTETMQPACVSLWILPGDTG